MNSNLKLESYLCPMSAKNASTSTSSASRPHPTLPPPSSNTNVKRNVKKIKKDYIGRAHV